MSSTTGAMREFRDIYDIIALMKQIIALVSISISTVHDTDEDEDDDKIA